MHDCCTVPCASVLPADSDDGCAWRSTLVIVTTYCQATARFDNPKQTTGKARACAWVATPDALEKSKLGYIYSYSYR